MQDRDALEFRPRCKFIRSRIWRTANIAKLPLIPRVDRLLGTYSCIWVAWWVQSWLSARGHGTGVADATRGRVRPGQIARHA